MNLIWVTNAKYLGDYRLQITFNDGTVKIFDGAELVAQNAIFRPLQSMARFRNFSLDDWTVTWGDIDIAPEYLYEYGAPV